MDCIEGLTVDDALVKYEPMVQKSVNGANTNYVCNREDLVQEGRMAVVLAFQSYNPEKGATLTTWTYHRIKDAVAEYQKRHLSVLSGGAYLQNALKKIGHDATVEELVAGGVGKKTALAASRLKDSFATADIYELENMIGSDGVSCSQLEAFNWQDYLNKQEIFAISHYFGLNEEKMSMKEIGQHLGKSRKSVSYMINKAIVKLRHAPGIEAYAF